MGKQQNEKGQVSQCQCQRMSSLFCPLFFLTTGHAFLETECAIKYNAA